LSPLSREAWLEAHAYLRPVAKLCAEVERAAGSLGVECASIPTWEDYRGDFRAGVPILQAPSAPIELGPAGGLALPLAEMLARDFSSDKYRNEARTLAAELHRESDAPERVVAWLLGAEGWTPASAGLLRYLGWTAVRRYLHPLVEAFDRWRDDEDWQRRYCPTCGALPAMAQLVGADQGRQRLLSCGRCGSRWGYPRTACPFCERDVQRLGVLAVAGEGGLRIDHCTSCRGYLKTYVGEGDEGVLLSDWSSLHLDFLARDRGLKRLATTLYDLGPSLDA
jgi:FdhE protein